VLHFAVRPNPTRARATISIGVPAATDVSVEAFDVLGRRVATVHEGPLAAGVHALTVDTAGWPAGAYVLRMVAGDATRTERLVVVR
jgi:hypothetical protein